MTDAHPMIEAEGLSKSYDGLKAIDRLSFQVMRGEILGFLGPNGAGKTTTMKILTSYIAPSEGRARVKGFDVVEESLSVRRHLGYLPENAPLYHDMIVRDYLEFVSELRQIPMENRKKSLKKSVEHCGLGDVMSRPIGDLSKGFRQRVGLAQAMIHEPEILILDEPTSGLDPNQIVEIRELIKELGKERTVILSTHNLGEVQVTCQRVIIIHKGKIVADGTQADLQASQGGYRCEALFASERLNPVDAESALRALEGVKRVERLPEGESGTAGFRILSEASGDPRAAIFRKAVEKGWILLELRREAMNLEQIFRQLTLTEGKGSEKEAKPS